MTAAAPSPQVPFLARPAATLYGVGRERAAQLGRLGILSVEDLLLHRPRRYEDRRHFKPVAELQLGEASLTRGVVVALGVKRLRRGQKSLFELVLDDGSARLHCRWWNLPFMENYFATGDEVVVFGKLQSLKPRTMDHPETEVVEAGEEKFIHFNRITPIYPLTEGLPQRWLRALVWRTVAAAEPHISDPWPAAALRASNGCAPAGPQEPGNPSDSQNSGQIPACPNRATAIRLLHFPENFSDIELARRRLALDELIELQRRLLLRRRNFEVRARALPCGGDNHLIRPFLARLGFDLTRGQTEVLREIRKDMSGRHPMRRLLQGDVGSGKTVVSACCALMALETGLSVALMAPTEILAEQHFLTFTNWFEPLGLEVELQTGSREPGAGARHPSQISGPGSQCPTLFIGTHALLESSFTPENLGLVLIDEQHKFGVSQREQLLRKGNYPHLLVMTATPIPRTLGLTLYGDLDVSTIEEMPPGRGTVKTFVRTADKLPKVLAFIREQLASGRQAYVVYPRVEETGPTGLKAVTLEFETLRQALAPFHVGLLHGRLKSKEKEKTMAAFRSNALHVLLATSLIEAGVDVPNATVMVIENAEQFGLAQLHQLRGRIGRGAHDSWCILVAAAKNREASQRLKVLEETLDGFLIAEADLKLRGPGELLGREQSGLPQFRFADLREDLDLIKQARQTATAGLVFTQGEVR